jgi:phage gpG-like protein
MSLQIRVGKDDLTPDLRKKLKAVENPTPILRAMGTQLVSITKRAFRDPSLRSAAWPAKRSGSPSNLIYKGVLISSIRITALDARNVTVGSDRKYAAIHQMGGTIKAKPGKSLVFTIGGKTIFAKEVKIPARPFFPFLPSGDLAPVAVEPVREAMLLAANQALGI